MFDVAISFLESDFGRKGGGDILLFRSILLVKRNIPPRELIAHLILRNVQFGLFQALQILDHDVLLLLRARVRVGLASLDQGAHEFEGFQDFAVLGRVLQFERLVVLPKKLLFVDLLVLPRVGAGPQRTRGRIFHPFLPGLGVVRLRGGCRQIISAFGGEDYIHRGKLLI